MYYQSDINNYLTTINSNIIDIGNNIFNRYKLGSKDIGSNINLELLSIGKNLLVNHIALLSKPTFCYKITVLDPSILSDITISYDGVSDLPSIGNTPGNETTLTKQQVAEHIGRKFADIAETAYQLYTIVLDDSVYIYTDNSIFTSGAGITLEYTTALSATNYLDKTGSLIDALNNNGSIQSYIPNIIDITEEYKDREYKEDTSMYSEMDFQIKTTTASINTSSPTSESNGHTQNTDTYLAISTSNEVSASEIRAHIDNTDIHLTEAQIQALIDAGGGGGGGISDIVEDTTPQFGGDVDLNSNDITGTGNIDITGTIESTGDITVNDAGNTANLKLIGSKEYHVRSNASDAFIIRNDTDGVNIISANATNVVTNGTVNSRNMTTDGSKLDGIEANADVTDAANVAAAIQSAASKSTPVNLDYVGLIDSADSFSLKQLTWDNLKSALQTAFTSVFSTVLDAFSKGTDTTDDITEGSTNLFASEGNIIDGLDNATIPTATVATGDKTLIQDIDDSNNLKTVTAQSIADLKVTELSEDTSPQLAGDLDTNGNNITGNPEIDGHRDIITESTTSRTLALTDAGDFIETTNSSAVTITIPTNASVAFTIGTEIDFFQYGTGALTIVGDTGVTLNGTSGGSATILAQWKGATIKKRGTNEWIIVGAI